MLEIIFLILKIIGFTLLGLLGLALLIVLAVLFVPVRYKAWGDKHEKLKAEGRITWLLHILRIRVTYADGKLKTKGKLLFFSILDSDEDVEEELSDDDDSLFPDEIDGDDLDTYGSTDKEVSAQTSESDLGSEEKGSTDKASEKEAEENTEENTEDGVKDKTEEVSENNTGDKAENNSETGSTRNLDAELSDRTVINAEHEDVNDTDSTEPETERNPGHKVGKKKKRKKDSDGSDEEEPKKQGIVKKVKNLYNIKNDPRARAFYHVAKKRVIKVVKHILPRKLRGSIRFGTGDPCSTGKILGAAAMMYPIYGGHISVEPVFEEKALEFDLYLRGRIRVITVLVPALRTYWSRDFRYVRKKIKKAVK